MNGYGRWCDGKNDNRGLDEYAMKLSKLGERSKITKNCDGGANPIADEIRKNLQANLDSKYSTGSS